MKTNGPGQSVDLLLEIIPLLERDHIPYAIVGAFAASFHGVIRASLDADAVISISASQPPFQEFMKEIKEAGFFVEYRSGDVNDPIPGICHIEDTYQNRVDLLLGIRGMPDGFFGRVVSTPFAGREIKIAGLEDFIAMKIYAGSAKDLQDAAAVLQVSGKMVNPPLLKQLTSCYGKEESVRLERLLKEVH